MSIFVTTLGTTEEIDHLSSEWHDLLRRSNNVMPFLLPEWSATWWAFFRQDTLLIRDALRVKIARDETGKLVGVLPLMASERPGSGPVRARILDFAGADPYITEQRAPIVDPAVEAEVGRAFARALLADPRWDWIQWQGLRKDSPFALAVEESFRLVWGDSQPGNLLTLAPSWDQFRAGLKRNIKEALRHCYNSLKRDGLSARLSVASTSAEVSSALDVFFRLHATRAASAAGVVHPDRFETVRSKRFLRAVCDALAARGVARVYTLHIGEQAVACRIGFQLPGCLYLYYSGFDPAWSKYSVMTTAVAEIFKHAIGQGVSSAHLSMGSDNSKARWGPHLEVFHSAVSVRPRLLSKTALDVYTFFRSHRGPVQEALGRLLPRRRFD